MRLALAPMALLALGACTSGREAPPAAAPPEVVFTATDFAFSGPDSVAPGYTTLRMVNHGSQPHHMMLGQMPAGQTMAELQAAMRADPNGEPALVWRGAASAVMPGDSTGMIGNLVPGRYVVMCFISDPADGVMHLAKGMMHEVVVAGPANTASAPTADGEIRMHDFGYTIPPLSAGTHTLHIVNDGPQTHELELIRLDEGATVEQFLAAFQPGAKGPPPGRSIGGPGALSKGLDNYWTVSLEPGSYAVLCFVPDSADGQPHIMKGMVQSFSVSAS